MKVRLGDTGVINEEILLGFKEVFACQTLFGLLQADKNKCSHHQVQHDSHQQGGEGSGLHVLPVDLPAPPGLEGLSSADLVGISVRIHLDAAGHKQEVPLERCYMCEHGNGKKSNTSVLGRHLYIRPKTESLTKQKTTKTECESH